MGKKKEIKKNLEVLELLNDKKRRKQRSDEEKESETQKCFMCVKNSSEKPSNQVVIEN